MKKLIGIFLLFTLLPPPGLSDSIHYFDSKNRPADEVLPLIRPLLNDSEAISDDGYQLFIKTSGSRINEIESLIQAVDKALRTFRISVTNDEYIARNDSSISASARIESGDITVQTGKSNQIRSGVTVLADTRKTQSNNNKTQFL